MKEKPSAKSKQQNKQFSRSVSRELGTHGQWVNGKWARSLVAALVLLLLLLAAAFYMPRSTGNENYTEPAIHHVHRTEQKPCRIKKECEVVCEYISGEPGHVAVDFILSDQSGCGDRPEVQSLEFNGCTFHNSKLSIGWLPLTKTINHLQVSNSTYYSIEDGAFSNLKFTSAARLTIVDFQVSWLSKGTFKGIQGLVALELRQNNFLVAVEEGFLDPVALTLKTIQIEEMNGIKCQTIKNITAVSMYPHLEELVIQFNINFDYLGPDLFTTMPSLKALHLSGNNMKSIDSNAFQGIRNSIELINIRGNSLTTLSEGTFEGLTLISDNNKYRFRTQLKDNPWNCNCSLVWLQDMMRESNATFMDNPVCRTPSNLLDVSLRDAVMCANETDTTTVRPSSTTEHSTTESSTIEESTTDSSTTEHSTTDSSTTEHSTTDSSTTEHSTTHSSTIEESTTDSSTTEQSTAESSTTEQATTTDSSTTESPSTTTPQQTTTDNPDTGTITVECKDLSEPKNLPQSRTLSLQESNIIYKSANMHNMPGKRRLMASMTFAQVDFKVTEEDGMVVAYLGNITGTLIQFDSGDKINHSCFTNATGNVSYKDLQPASSYTFCLHTEESQEVFTYSCRALTTLPIPNKRAWLLREDQFTVISIGLSALLVCGLLCSAIVFCVVRRHPDLLKGSKRVVVVKHRAVDVMVLPKQPKHNTSSNSSYRSHEQQIYSTDSSSQRTYSHSISQASAITGRSSSTSYVSAVEPTARELMQWRIEQMRVKVRKLFSHEDSSLNLFSDDPPPLPPYPLRRESSMSYLHRQSNVSSYSSFSV